MIIDRVKANVSIKMLLDEKTEQYCMEILSERLEGETEPGRNEQISLIENLPVPEQI